MDKSLRVQVIMAAVDRLTTPMRNVLKGTRGLSEGLKETNNRLKALNAAQRDVGRFRELRAGLTTTAGELDQARGKAAALAQQFNSTSNPTRKLTRDFAKAREAVNTLEDAHRAQSRELQTLRQRMNEAGASEKGLAQHERDLRAEIRRTNAELDERKAKLDAMSRHQSRVAKARAGFDRSQELAGNLAGAGAGATAAGAALLVPLYAANKTAGDYEATLTTVAQKANLNRQAAAALGGELTKVGQATNQLPADVVAATDALTGLGAELDQAKVMIPDIAKASTAYQTSMEDMGRATYSAIDTLNVPAKETTRVLDIMALAGKKGAFEVQDMAQYFPSLTAAAAGLGQQGVGAVADLAAALQITRKGAGDSAEAATNLGNLLQKISSPLTVKNFKKFGIDLEKELKAAAKRGESPIETITNLTKKATGGDMSKLGYLFEDAQVQKALRPLMSNLKEYQDIRAAALGANGTVAADFTERLRDQNEAAKAAEINVRALGLTVGAQLAPTVKAVADIIGKAAGAVTSWAQKNPELAGNLAKIAGIVGVVLVLVGGAALAFAAILGPFALAGLAFAQALPVLGLLGGAFIAVGEAVVAAGAFIMANPIILIVAAIAIAAFLLIKNWSKVSAFFVGLWDGIKAMFAGVVAWFRAMAPTFGKMLLVGLLGPLGLIIVNWSKIAPFFSGLWERVKGYTSAAVEWFQGLGARFREFGSHLISGLITGIVGRLGELKSTVVGVASKAAAWFKERLGIHSPSRVFAGFGGDTMAGLAQGLQRGQREPLDVVVDTAAGLARTMAATARRSPVGMLAGGLAVAAIGAPAAVAGAAPAPASYTINVYPAPGMDEAALARLVARAIEDHERKKAVRGRAALADTSED